jgi:hypothetical protein
MRDLFLREPPLLPPFLKGDRGGLDNNVISPNPSLKGVDEVAPTGTTQAYRKAKRVPPVIAPDINAGKWEGYTPPPMPRSRE